MQLSFVFDFDFGFVFVCLFVFIFLFYCIRSVRILPSVCFLSPWYTCYVTFLMHFVRGNLNLIILELYRAFEVRLKISVFLMLKHRKWLRKNRKWLCAPPKDQMQLSLVLSIRFNVMLNGAQAFIADRCKTLTYFPLFINLCWAK